MAPSAAEERYFAQILEKQLLTDFGHVIRRFPKTYIPRVIKKCRQEARNAVQKKARNADSIIYSYSESSPSHDLGLTVQQERASPANFHCQPAGSPGGARVDDGRTTPPPPAMPGLPNADAWDFGDWPAEEGQNFFDDQWDISFGTEGG